MQEIKIAYGNNRNAKTWTNKTITFEALCERLSHTIRTTESVEEYKKMKKADRDNTKDHGGFVGGFLKDNSRKQENTVLRSFGTLDGDSVNPNFIEEYCMLSHYKSCLYTTHSHTPEEPRIRLLVFFSRDVTADEYVAIMRYFAQVWGIDQFDECSYKLNQLMYWPTTPSNGEYIFQKIDGEELDVDKFLSEHPNWKDYSLLPTSSRESVVKRTAKKQEDPLAKSGIVGAFCRAYTIEDAISTFLSKVYEPSSVEGRYSYKAGESTSGVVVYDHKFAYSHHATDPASGCELNAFDLVRIHLFGNDEPKSSFRKMAELASNDEKVKVLVSQERRASAEDDFTQDNEDWTAKLKYMKGGVVLENSVENLNLILQNDPDFKNFAFNELAGRIQITGPVPWERPEGNLFWRDADTAHLKTLLDQRYLPFSTRNHDVAFAKITDDRSFNPVRDYLDSLPAWDKVKRVEDLFIKYLEADDTEYVRAVTRKTFAAAVARIYQPGVKFDCVPVLDGAQGIGKSTIVKDLIGPEYYSEALSLTDMSDKSAAEKLQGFWIVEIGELAGMKKADIEKVKSFLSTSDDKYRPSYGKTVESHPRQCIIMATVNGERGYLRDITGNRRFWIIKTHQQEQCKKWNFDRYFRDQFWAEAKRLWQDGEKLYLEGDLLQDSEKAQREAMEADDRQGMVEAYLSTLLPANWAEMDLSSRREFLASPDSPVLPKGTVQRTSVSNAEIWCECFLRSLSDLKSSDSYALAGLMLQVDGWERTNAIQVQKIYGRQRVYKPLKK